MDNHINTTWKGPKVRKVSFKGLIIREQIRGGGPSSGGRPERMWAVAEGPPQVTSAKALSAGQQNIHVIVLDIVNCMYN